MSSWGYFKKQIALCDLHTYACTVLSYKPLYIPCTNVSPDVLFITFGEHEDELSLFSKIKQSMQAVTKRIHRTSVWKSESIDSIQDLDNALTILASEISILGPKAVFIFYAAIMPHLIRKIQITAPFVVERLSDDIRHKTEINERLQQMVSYLTAIKR